MQQPVTNSANQQGSIAERMLIYRHNQTAVERYLDIIISGNAESFVKNREHALARKKKRVEEMTHLAHEVYSSRGERLRVPISGSCDKRLSLLLREIHKKHEKGSIHVASFDQTTTSRNLGGIKGGRFPWL